MTALADLLTIAAIGLAYYLGRQHQARKDEQAWANYGRWLHDQRGRIVGRFQRQRQHVDVLV